MNNPDSTNLFLTTNPLARAIAGGHCSLLVTGNLHDLCLEDHRITYRPQFIVDWLFEQGYLVIRYSKSQGGRIHKYTSLTPEDKKAVDSRLNAVALTPLLHQECQNNSEEIHKFFRAVSRLLQLQNGENKPIALVLDYTEHLAPRVDTSAAAAEEHTFVTETLHYLAKSPALRKTGNLMICMVRDGFQNSILNDLEKVEYSYPDEQQTKAYIEFALDQKDEAEKPKYGSLPDILNAEELARLMRGLRLQDIENLLREARGIGVQLDQNQVLTAKAEAIRSTSEGTLAVMSSKLTLDNIIGLKVIKKFFIRVADKLKLGDKASPRAILMVGPPGTSKSSFAPILASLCKFNILQFQNIKNMFVGESERRLNLALSLVESLSPAILFIDEITEMIPSRNSSFGDGGVSLDLLGQLFQFSARDDLRGQVLLLAASNVPEKLDPAWHSRFVIVPFLELVPEEMKSLFPNFEGRVTGKCTLNPNDSKIIEASELLHQKGASPRKAMDVVNHALLLSKNGSLTSNDILAAACDYVGEANPMTVAYTSLVAISLTSFQSLLPWSIDPKNYVYPWYLEGIVDKNSGEIDRDQIRKKIEEYRRYANL